MYKVLIVFGTRPEAIKMAPLIKELEKREEIELKVCITAQHRSLLDQVLNTFQIIPDYDLNIMKEGQTLTDITNSVLKGVGEVIIKEQPNIVLVHGDTTTSFASALAAFYQKVSVGHVEAGLRTYNKYSPYPEEINRQIISNIADLNFAPTTLSYQNLIKENKDSDTIFVTGNTAIDAMHLTITDNWSSKDFTADNQKIILLTMHRRENLGTPMTNVFKAIKRIALEFPCQIIFPMHPNPAIKKIADPIFENIPNIKIISPQEVSEFHNLQNKSYLILTDSGGIQEEAPSLGKPVLVLRDTTERPEGVEAGTLKLVGTDEEQVYQEIKELLTNQEAYNKMSQAKNPYGDGYASRRIADIIIGTLKEKEFKSKKESLKIYLKEKGYTKEEIKDIIQID